MFDISKIINRLTKSEKTVISDTVLDPAISVLKEEDTISMIFSTLTGIADDVIESNSRLTTQS